jgi:adenylate cyclase
MPPVRRLTAILAADVAGYSRLMGADEEGTHERLKAHRRELVDPKINEHSGRIVKTTGDGMLAEFPSVVGAVRCAAEVQRAMIDREASIPEDRRIKFRVGINVGDIIVDDDDIIGESVNVAARLEALSDPGGLCVSRTVRDHIRDKLAYAFADLGEQSVKNIPRPVRVYTLRPEAVADLPTPNVLPIPAISQPAVAPRLSIVVLPFANLSNDPEQEYFADGITDDLTTDLSRISGCFVIARNTAFTYKGKSIDAKEIGRELGVRYVLVGSVRRAADRVRVNVQLINAETGAHLWADRFDTDRANVEGVQNEITGRLAQSLSLELMEAVDRRIAQESAIDPDAQALVLRGWAWYYRATSAVTVREAQLAFEQALEIDRSSVDAKIGLATVLARKLAEGWSPPRLEDQAHAERLLLEVLEGDTNRPAAHYAMGMLRRVQNRLAEARIEFETTIALDRNHARSYFRLGQTLMYLGRPEAGIPHIEKAIRLNPRDPNIARPYANLGLCHLLLGQVDKAINLLRQARAANPRFYWIHSLLAGALGFSGDIDEARAALAESIRLNPEVKSFAQWRAYMPWITGREHWALLEKTLNIGLRRAGFPDE